MNRVATRNLTGWVLGVGFEPTRPVHRRGDVQEHYCTLRVGREGFEPPSPVGGWFTAICVRPLRYRPMFGRLSGQSRQCEASPVHLPSDVTRGWSHKSVRVIGLVRGFSLDATGSQVPPAKPRHPRKRQDSNLW